MNTREIATHLAEAASAFPFLGPIRAEDLLEVVRCELGHEAILDDFQPYAGAHSMAIGPGRILHIISGNTPHAGLQSLIRGLLLKAHNLCKIPGRGLPEIAEFQALLPPALADRVEISSNLPPDWLESAGAVIVFGTDETIESIRARIRPDQRFLAHGHRVSIGIVLDDPEFLSVPGAAMDASLFDQQGCLSPHAFFIRQDARTYAAQLAAEMDSVNSQMPRSPISPGESARIRSIREQYAFEAANNPGVQLWTSPGSTDWTVIYDESLGFTPSCLNRVVFVKPLAGDLRIPHLSTIGLWPATLENARRVRSWGASRLCEIGRMQLPPATWHQDAQQTLAPLVEWIDFHPEDHSQRHRGAERKL